MPINPCTGARGATPPWTCIAANPPGHAPPQVLRAQGAKGRSRQAGPSGQSTNQTSFGHVKGKGGDGQKFAAANFLGPGLDPGEPEVEFRESALASPTTGRFLFEGDKRGPTFAVSSATSAFARQASTDDEGHMARCAF